MRGLGKRLRGAADALGLTDSEVARRLGLSQSRYHNYVAESSEPDLDTVLRISRVLAVTPNDLLSDAETQQMSQDDLRRARIQSAATSLHDDALGYAADLMDALVESQRRNHGTAVGGLGHAVSQRVRASPKTGPVRPPSR